MSANISTQPPLLIASLVAILVFVGIFLLYLGVARVIENNKQKKAEALKRPPPRIPVPLDETPAGAYTAELSLDEAERQEMLENARMMARENPQKTAKALRHWLSDDS